MGREPRPETHEQHTPASSVAPERGELRQDRRDFLRRAARAGGGILLARSGLAGVPHAPTRSQAQAFRGARPGQERAVDGIWLCWCPAGAFTMGSPPDEPGHRPDEAQVQVTLSRGFWAGKFEVTQAQWRRVVGAFPDRAPSAQFGEGDAFPVYWISFLEAEDFCSRLTRRARESRELPAGWEIRLPTEAQWEYACRAGTRTAFSFGAVLRPDLANYSGAFDGSPRGGVTGGSRAVGSYAANAWGLHDMHGNVWEWCRDWYHARLPGGTDPDLYDVPGVPNRDGTYSRVRRGGAWIEDGWACRAALRLRYEPPRRSDHIGFRVVVVEV
jgi:sulfatase modifying factor 1